MNELRCVGKCLSLGERVGECWNVGFCDFGIFYWILRTFYGFRVGLVWRFIKVVLISIYF